MVEEVKKVKCSFDDCQNDGKYLVRAHTRASGEIQAMVCETCKPRLLGGPKNISMGTKQ